MSLGKKAGSEVRGRILLLSPEFRFLLAIRAFLSVLHHIARAVKLPMEVLVEIAPESPLDTTTLAINQVRIPLREPRPP